HHVGSSIRLELYLLALRRNRLGLERNGDRRKRDDADVNVRMPRAERDGRQCLRRESKRADLYAVLAERKARKVEVAVGSAGDVAGGSTSGDVREVNGGGSYRRA